jgi:hypothetical protein
MEAHDKYRIVQEIFNSIYQHNDSANGVKILESGFATIRAEALRDAGERAVAYVKTTHWRDIEYDRDNYEIDIDDLRAAIIGEVKE